MKARTALLLAFLLPAQALAQSGLRLPTRRAGPRPDLARGWLAAGLRPLRHRAPQLARGGRLRARAAHAVDLHAQRSQQPRHGDAEQPRARGPAPALALRALLAPQDWALSAESAVARCGRPVAPAGFPHRRAAPLQGLLFPVRSTLRRACAPGPVRPRQHTARRRQRLRVGPVPVDRGVLEREAYEAQNRAFYEQYKAGTLDIHEFLGFALRPLADHSPQGARRAGTASSCARIEPDATRGARAGAPPPGGGDLCAIITSTNSFVTRPIAREFGIDHLIATEPEQRDGRFTGQVAGTPSFREGKLVRLDQWLAGLGRRFAEFAEHLLQRLAQRPAAARAHSRRQVAWIPDETLAREARAAALGDDIAPVESPPPHDQAVHPAGAGPASEATLRVPREKHGLARDGLSPSAAKVCSVLRDAGFSAYVVGGAVRDLLLGIESQGLRRRHRRAPRAGAAAVPPRDHHRPALPPGARDARSGDGGGLDLPLGRRGGETEVGEGRARPHPARQRVRHPGEGRARAAISPSTRCSTTRPPRKSATTTTAWPT